MTLSDYLSATRFPLSTKAGIDAQSQLLLDAHVWDTLQQIIKGGDQLTMKEWSVHAELSVKMQHNARLAIEAQGL